MTSPIRGISSMATRQLFADLVALHEQAGGGPVAIESVGGVDAARRVRAGEVFDFVALASTAIAQLADAGLVIADSIVDVVRSDVAVAVRTGTPRPDISTEPALKAAVLGARSIGFSTGPSGSHLTQLFERWGVAEQVAAKLVQAPPGVPVASMVANGDAELGFQQLSELIDVPGVDVIGNLPAGAQFVTTFSVALHSRSSQPAAVRDFFRFLASGRTRDAKQRRGMSAPD